MFRGISYQRIDANRRIYIPTHFLDVIKESQKNAIVMTIEEGRIV
jgi:DNA-binding transcriptional regulator/RsmH inhibitor MraZ